MLKGLRRQRRGFTLIETVVTVGIVATMAAVVIPQVMKQFDTADPTRIQNDLKNLQLAIETFNVNVKTLPGDLDDLVNAISSTTDTTLVEGTTLPVYLDPSQTGAWNGPYVDFAVLDIIDGSDEPEITTAFGARILDTFVCYDTGDFSHGSSIEVDASPAEECPAVVGQQFLAIQILDLATAVTDDNFEALNELFDGPNETTPETQGRIRFDANGGGPDIVYFLAVPLN